MGGALGACPETPSRSLLLGEAKGLCLPRYPVHRVTGGCGCCAVLDTRRPSRCAAPRHHQP
eukprot:4704226-Pleurochrysis_carterae.AAC.2